ncbi:hypothetical protein [Vibrio mediterranei]|uniref:Uncharacterized protein n=1 Tax=Vibrio mediterranei TaxID=689 RepID=A0A3G4VBI7_9VIBR|nr:hypothetical protein [Vibrio mediterranei]AYV20531.1 hypothetical protein ECB94_04080 [Vibrio mediterranei]
MTEWNKKVVDFKSNAMSLLSYTLPIKVISGFMLTAIGSASVLGLLSEFAVYKYAISSGFRVPVEGIPYLKPTVTLLSLIAILVAFVGFVATYSFAKFSAVFISAPDKFISLILSHFNIKPSSLSKSILFRDMRESSTLKAVFISGFSSFLVTYLVFSSLANDFLGNGLVSTNITLSQVTFFDNPIFDMVVLFSLVFVIYFSAFRPAWIKYTAFTSALLSIVLVLVFMFNTRMYGEFLNITGFGGGRPVILFNDNDEIEASGKMLIQSNDYYIIVDDKYDVTEYPVNGVSKVRYKQEKYIWF